MEVLPQRDSGQGPIPEHVAIIMDGNGRWATKRSLQRLRGHEQGAEAVREAVRGCGDLGIRYLTLFAFSSENWSRPIEEINHLMGLFRFFFRKEINALSDAGVKVKFIGDIKRLPDDIQSLVAEIKERTQHNSKLILTIALSYGSQSEIAGAMRIIGEKIKKGELSAEDISEEMITRHLDTADLPDPDLLIRTSGEKRLSNFLLWQCAYTEFVFLDTLWPDFRKEDLMAAVAEYGNRNRRYGAL
ncbi:MAG: di-trans,poly-cis-decaprenylcistransferase [Sneathiella sp.]|jgi:undecaprenyl diphosphate synthase|uniref:isoprenyl transferase n=1 Tax=Sneathiella sp. TaxID=1964365 RepID=UPI000C5E0B4C|nr:isoprenyl transferase [Sneathiella sp.]MAL79706.1 di-trans,poly-cis-decaprenylcistransferase [Sneathiella sp.]